MDLKLISVIFGCVLLTAIVIKYLQKDENKPAAGLTCFLAFLGFALVASPVWTNISFKSNDIELLLINETTQQMDSYVDILSNYDAKGAIAKTNWNGTSSVAEKADMVSLASELDMQKLKIEQAIAAGDLQQAILETRKGTELIAHIAMQVNVR